MINFKNNDNHDANKNDPQVRHITIGVGQLDPRLLEILPPEIRQMIEKDMEDLGRTTASEEESVKRDKIKFDYKMVNCNQDLKELTEKLKKSEHKDYGILLYGCSGAGKSYYAEWLAQELGMPFIKKRSSDLIERWVGSTEKNIRNAFKEAREKKAILVLDEADSFLFDRKFAKQDFQAGHVNEVLTQMEDHPYPFVMTTNLKEKLDPAAMRRFIFKIKYKPMAPKNINAGVSTYFGKEFKLTDEQVVELDGLCAGDFKVAKKKCQILDGGIFTNELVFKYLKKELDEKNIVKPSNPINV